MRRAISLSLLLCIITTGCTYREGCGYLSSDADLMGRVVREMTRQGIAYETLSDGSVNCRSEDAAKFRALLQNVEAQWDRDVQAHLQAMAQTHTREVGLHIDRPHAISCITGVLNERKVAFKVETTGGDETVFWHPENEQDKAAVISASFKCIQERERAESPNYSFERTVDK